MGREPTGRLREVRHPARTAVRRIRLSLQNAKKRSSTVDNAQADCAIERLGADHRRLDVVFAEVRQTLADGGVAAARLRFCELREGLEHHIEAGEQVLFPVFENTTGVAQGGPPCA